jgi:SAM-dependent methyltransferase
MMSCWQEGASEPMIHCPLCGTKSSEFFPSGHDTDVTRIHQVIGTGYRAHARCPGCGSGDRERLIYLYSVRQNVLRFAAGRRVLHIAPERALFNLMRQALGLQYHAADMNPKPGVAFMDITEIELSSNSIDIVICNHVLEHIRDDRRAMRELCRGLRPAGWAVLQVPMSFVLDRTIEDPSADTPEKRFRLFGQEDHVRIYGRDYVDRLREAGFQVSIHDPVEMFGTGAVRAHGLLAGEQLIIATKPDVRVVPE